jgi:hypothetical protein
MFARGFDRWDAAVYGERDVRHALGGRGYHVALVARTRIRPQLADGKMDVGTSRALITWAVPLGEV